MRIRVFAHDSNPAVDVPLCHKSPAYVADLIATKQAFTLDARSVQLFAPDTPLLREEQDVRVRSFSHLKPGRLYACAIQEGRVGQFTIGYPIPYVFEGHLREPRAAEVNGTVPEVA